MDQGIHFISGLPRSGSTLLASILRQNPRHHAMMSSPVGAMYGALLGSMSRKNEAAVFIDADQKRQVLRGLFDNYYAATHAKQLVFDTNRLWCTKLPALSELFPDAKVICCVRSLSWIVDSIERLIRKNAFELSGLFGFEPGGTVYTRVQRLASSDGMVGFALDALREAFYGEQAERLILVDYEALVREPQLTMQRLYQFLGEAPFAHDFEHVEYQADEFDLPLGTPGLHAVAQRVQWRERATVLPPDVFRRFENDAFWRIAGANPRNVTVIGPVSGG